MLTGKSGIRLFLLFIAFFILTFINFSAGEVLAAGGPGENPGITGDQGNSPGDEGNIQNEMDKADPEKNPGTSKSSKEKKKKEEEKKSPENKQPKDKNEEKNSKDISNKKTVEKPKPDSAKPVKKESVKKQESPGSEKVKKQEPENREDTDNTPWELKEKKSTSNQAPFQKLPSLDGVKVTPAKKKTSPKISLDKKEGLIPGFYITFNNKVFKFADNPLAYIDGKIFVCASDPDFKKLFDEMGLTYSWFSYSGKLFVYLRKGSVNWNTNQKTATVGDREVTVPEIPRKSFSGDYIPLDSLAALLGFEVAENDNQFDIRPTVHLASEFSRENKTLNILLLSATEIKYEARYQARPSAIRLKIPRGSYERDIERLFVEGVQIRVNNKVDSDNLYITCEFPPHWKGEIIPTSFKNEVVIQMKPNLMYAYGIKDETLKDFKLIKAGKQVYAQFETSAPVQYFWSWDKDEGTLYVDVPFCRPSSSLQLKGFKSHMIKNMDMTTLQPEGINITRFRIDLEPGAAFMIGPPEKQKGHAFALLIGPAESIPYPTPAIGGYHILTICGGTDVIVIDPGHGGSDPGACNGKLGLREKDITLDISKRMAEILSKRGWKIYLTRHTDTDLTYPGSPDADELQARADVANNCKASVFISIHCNASTNKGLRGSSYHWWKSDDKELALALKGSLGSNVGTHDKGLRKDQFYVLSHSKVPACLVETAFLSNHSDAKLLASPAYRQKIAENLAGAIALFLQQKNLARKDVKNGSSGEE